MGRPSKAKLLEITLKLQQNLCANCSVPLKEISERITKISPYSEVNLKTHKGNHWAKKDIDRTISEALLTVFEAALKINKTTMSPTDTILYMCKHCASSLSELYWAYKTFLEITKQESYIRAAIKNSFLWKEKGNRDETLKDSQNAKSKSKTGDKPNDQEKIISERVSRSKDTDKKRTECEDSCKTELGDTSEIESDNYEFCDDPNDEDYLPGTKSTETISTVIEQKCKTERRKQATPRRRKIETLEQPNRSISIKKTRRSTRKCRFSEQPKRKLRKRLAIIRRNDPKSKPEVQEKKIYSKRESNYKPTKKKNTKPKYERNSCRVCGKKFESSILLKTHSTKCKKVVKSSVCRYCGKKFSLKLLRDRHERVFHAKELYQKGENLACKECGKTFKNLTFLRRHASVHSTAKPFQCETCLKSFKRFDTLQEHQKVKSHTLSLGTNKPRPHNADSGNKNHPCKICSQIFKHKVSLFRHESKLHMEERPFGCLKCWKRYRSKEKLANHLKTAHENRKEKERVIYKCELCDKTYTYLYSYKAHVVTHVIDKPFLCSQCGNSFRQKQGFLRHMSTMHKPENRHTCNVCGKSFKRKDHLTQHLRGKTHGKPVKEKKLKKTAAESTSNVISHTKKYIHEPQKSSAVLTSSTHLTNVSSGHRTTAIIVEAPPPHPSYSNNFLQPNIVRPGVIVPAGSSIETHTLQNSETNQQSAGKPASFTFSASNLFFDF